MTRKLWLYPLLVIALLLLSARIAMPYAAQWYINKTLSQPGSYDGRVGDVDLMLWRGAYSLEQVLLYKENGEVDKPLFRANYVEFSLLWSALFDGSAVGSVIIREPEINFVDGRDQSRSQIGRNENWLSIANQLFPLKIDRLDIFNGQIAFHNPDTTPQIHISLHDIRLILRNLVNSRDLSKDMVATLNATGQTAEQGYISASGSMDPSTAKPTFDINVEASNVALVNFRNLLDTYAPFDLEAGSLEFAMELAADNGSITGYAKPVIHNVEVFSWKGDIERDGDGPFEAIGEMASAFVTELFENQSEDQIATRIPIEGTLSDPETDTFSTLGGVLKNAFIKAMQGSLENSITLDDVKTESEPDEASAEDAAGV
ncbi:DUF748 domain-containing protein [Alteromonas sp. H39]|uniref:DUF748 domain-containing protein n=1 Tax=Alteromonas sp. H39 TaxID=3389876 RepID=UPI0039E18D2F